MKNLFNQSARVLALVLAVGAAFLSAPPAFADSCEESYGRKDYKTAHRLCLPLAEQGDAVAQNNLGVMYSNGWGVPRNYAEAIPWYRKSAEQGHASAQNNLGVAYENGDGVPKNYAEAMRWYRKAAEQGHASAQNNLGVAYENGDGVPKNYAEAMRWYRKAAEQGDYWAQSALGAMYFKGKGVEDYVQAYKWFSLAATQRVIKTNTLPSFLSGLEKCMTKEQIAEAQRLATEFHKSRQ